VAGQALAGLALGLGLAAGFSRLVATFLYGVPPTDAPTYEGVAVVLVGVALLACYLPARRAAKIDPIIALRTE
jgi:putative ABC transport system permease protein